MASGYCDSDVPIFSLSRLHVVVGWVFCVTAFWQFQHFGVVLACCFVGPEEESSGFLVLSRLHRNFKQSCWLDGWVRGNDAETLRQRLCTLSRHARGTRSGLRALDWFDFTLSFCFSLSLSLPLSLSLSLYVPLSLSVLFSLSLSLSHSCSHSLILSLSLCLSLSLDLSLYLCVCLPLREDDRAFQADSLTANKRLCHRGISTLRQYLPLGSRRPGLIGWSRRTTLAPPFPHFPPPPRPTHS